MASFNERDGGGYRHRFGQVKGVGIFADKSKHFEGRVVLGGRGTPMIRIRETKIRLSPWGERPPSERSERGG
jgi:hypothetical protein